jgi:hypothetical protein
MQMDQVTTKRVTSAGKEFDDCSMYSGSIGTIFGMHKNYYTYLRRIGDMSHLDQVHNDLNDRILQNKESLEIQFDRGEGSQPSFFRSEAVGVAVMQCLMVLTSHVVPTCEKLQEVRDVIKIDILPSLKLCEKRHDLLSGSAGYLYSLLLLWQKLDDLCSRGPLAVDDYEEEKQKALSIMVILQDAAEEVAVKIADKCTAVINGQPDLTVTSQKT